MRFTSNTAIQITATVVACLLSIITAASAAEKNSSSTSIDVAAPRYSGSVSNGAQGIDTPQRIGAVDHTRIVGRRFVVNIESGNIFAGKKFGRGICLDTPCIHVLTNYHVAAFIGPGKVEGVPIGSAQFATAASDANAAPIPVAGRVERYDPQEDMAIVTLIRALPSQFGAARFASYEPAAGQPVMRYPELTGTHLGHVRGFGTIGYIAADGSNQELDSGLLADFDSPAGSSGGALCDENGQVMGLIIMQNGSLSLPVRVIAEFLRTAAPALWAQLHLTPEKVTMTADSKEANPKLDLPEYVEPIVTKDPAEAVTALRERASEIRRKMTHLVGEVEIRSWRAPTKSSTSRFEIGLFTSGTTFRRISANGKREAEITEVPILRQPGFVPGAEWDYLLDRLGHATLTYSGETKVNNELVHVFHFQMRCPMREKRPNGMWSGDIDCSGDILADAEFNPELLRVSFSFSPASIVSDMQIEVQFHSTTLEAGQAYYLPTQVSISGRLQGHSGIYSASATLQNFHLFTADHVIRTDGEVQVAAVVEESNAVTTRRF